MPRDRGSRRPPARRRCRAAPSARRRCRASPSRRTGSGSRRPRRRSARAALAHERVHLLRDLRGRGAAGADRPDRLVGDHELAARASGTSARLPASCPATTSIVRPASRSSSDSPTQTIGAMFAAEQRRGLVRHVRVALAVERAPLAVADDRIAAAELGQHAGRDLAGERALRLRVHVLRREGHVRAGERAREPVERGERRGDRDVDALRAADQRQERLRERDRLGAVLCIFQFAAKIGVRITSAPARRRRAARGPGRTRARRRRRSRGG